MCGFHPLLHWWNIPRCTCWVRLTLLSRPVSGTQCKGELDKERSHCNILWSLLRQIKMQEPEPRPWRGGRCAWYEWGPSWKLKGEGTNSEGATGAGGSVPGSATHEQRPSGENSKAEFPEGWVTLIEHSCFCFQKKKGLEGWWPRWADKHSGQESRSKARGSTEHTLEEQIFWHARRKYKWVETLQQETSVWYTEPTSAPIGGEELHFQSECPQPFVTQNCTPRSRAGCVHLCPLSYVSQRPQETNTFPISFVDTGKSRLRAVLELPHTQPGFWWYTCFSPLPQLVQTTVVQ